MTIIALITFWLLFCCLLFASWPHFPLVQQCSVNKTLCRARQFNGLRPYKIEPRAHGGRSRCVLCVWSCVCLRRSPSTQARDLEQLAGGTLGHQPAAAHNRYQAWSNDWCKGRFLWGAFLLGYKQSIFCLQAINSHCPLKSGNRAGSSRNESDYSRRGTQVSFPLLESRNCDNFGLAHLQLYRQKTDNW